MAATAEQTIRAYINLFVRNNPRSKRARGSNEMYVRSHKVLAMRALALLAAPKVKCKGELSGYFTDNAVNKHAKHWTSTARYVAQQKLDF
jgi:hypothetical protein